MCSTSSIVLYVGSSWRQVVKFSLPSSTTYPKLIKSGPWLRHFSFQSSVSLVTQLDLSGPQPSRMLWIKQKTGLSVDSHVSGIGAVKAGCVIQWRTRVELVPCQGLFNLFNINKILNLSWVTNYVTQAKIFNSNITWSGSVHSLNQS